MFSFCFVNEFIVWQTLWGLKQDVLCSITTPPLEEQFSCCVFFVLPHLCLLGVNLNVFHLLLCISFNSPFCSLYSLLCVKPS